MAATVAVAAAALLCVTATTTGCKGPGPIKIGDATLPPLAAGGDPLPPEAENAPTVVVLRGQTPTIPNAPVVKLAIDRMVPWGMVKAITDGMKERGQTALLLVADRQKIMHLRLEDEHIGRTISVRAELHGKLCVLHPAAHEEICSQTASKRYIDGSQTRELVRKAVLGYQRADVFVELPLALIWGDAVTAVGASRSCCGTRAVRVRLFPDE